MPDDTTRMMPPVEVPEATMALVVVEGADAGASAAVEEPILVGSSELCDLSLRDRAVSRRHLAVSRSETGLRVRDEGSRNGAWIGSTRVREVELAPGDTIRIGTTVLRAEEVLSGVQPASAIRVRGSFGRFRGASSALQPLYAALERIAPSDITVLIEGESGVGKELLAEAIHELGPRAAGPFVVVDCGSLPETLIEAELLGHERGAFTGATHARVGAFEQAHGGTVFLDEIGELPTKMQTRLLRVLDRRQIRRIGGAEPIDVDVRVVAATNRNLEREVEEGSFRLDLFHRLAVAPLRVPPLRARPEDIEPLARHFVGRAGGDDAVLDEATLGRMLRHSWPGNARELRNYVERLVILGDAEVPSAVLGASEDSLRTLATAGMDYRVSRARLLEEFGRIYTADMLARHDGNVSHAADAAGIARRHFQRLKSEG